MARSGPGSGACVRYTKTFLAYVGSLALLCFIILAIIRLDADVRHQSFIVRWWQAAIVAGISCGSFMLYLLVNYLSLAPRAGDIPRGANAQYYYDLLTQLLVKKLHVRSIDNYNESLLLRAVLRGVLYVVIVAYCCSALANGCACDVPYHMVTVALICCYFLRFLMLLFSCTKQFQRLRLMTDEARGYQESMDTNRLFFVACKQLTEKQISSWVHVVDLLLWCATVAFAVLGSIWIFEDTCEKVCPKTFHILYCLLIAVYIVEGTTFVSWFVMAYYERTRFIEAFDELARKIYSHHQATELKQKHSA